MTLYIQQLQQKIVANSIEQSKGRIENMATKKASKKKSSSKKKK